MGETHLLRQRAFSGGGGYVTRQLFWRKYTCLHGKSLLHVVRFQDLFHVRQTLDEFQGKSRRGETNGVDSGSFLAREGNSPLTRSEAIHGSPSFRGDTTMLALLPVRSFIVRCPLTERRAHLRQLLQLPVRFLWVARHHEPGRLPGVEEVSGGLPSRIEGIVVVPSTRNGLNVLNHEVVVVTQQFARHASITTCKSKQQQRMESHHQAKVIKINQQADVPTATKNLSCFSLRPFNDSCCLFASAPYERLKTSGATDTSWTYLPCGGSVCSCTGAGCSAPSAETC